MSGLESGGLPSVDRLVDEIIEIKAAQGPSPEKTWTAETTLEQAEIDSLALIELLFQLEEKYGVTIDFNANSAERKLMTLGDVARFARASATSGPNPR